VIATIFAIVIAVILFVINQIYWLWREPEKKTSIVQASGRIEGDEIHLGVRTAGQVKTVSVKEGDPVRIGERLLRLDDRDVQTKLRAANSQFSLAQSAEAEALGGLRNLKAEAEVGAAQHIPAVNLENQQSPTPSPPKGFLKKMVGGLTGAKTKQMIGMQMAKQAKLEALRAKLQMAQVQAQVQSTKAEMQMIKGQTLGQLQAAKVQAEQARLAKDEASVALSNFVVHSPIDGVCATRSVQPGEIVAPGQILLTLVDLNSVYLKAFVPEQEIGKVKIGQRAKIFLDSAPKNPLNAKVSSIDSESSFTPESVYFKKDRVKQVFGVKLTIDKPNRLAKPGMPADAEIQLDQSETKR
jgi:HlyD family secretion protein